MVDANIFLEILLEQKKTDPCASFLAKLKSGEEEATITDFLVDSIILVMEKHGKSVDDLATFIISLSGYKGLRVYFLSLADRMIATRHMKVFGLDFDDATTYQAMKRLNVKTVVSFDDDFDSIKDITRIQLEER